MDINELLPTLGVICVAAFIGVLLVIGVFVFIAMSKSDASLSDPDPWRRSIDAKLLKEAQEKEEKEAIARERYKKEGEIRSIQLAAHRKQAIDTWAKKSGFRCHCCGVWSKGPWQKDVGSIDNEILEDDWSLPADLWKCIKCGFFTCEKCMHRNVCKDHA